MNIKIKSSGVFCLIGDDYDKVYSALKRQFGDGEDQLFTERTPGHEYLQWELPGEHWNCLASGDPLMSKEVRDELKKRQEKVALKFGSNQSMAQKVMSVPSDEYIYYKNDESGKLIIRLTVWGYRYPERIHSGAATGELDPEKETEIMSVTVLYDGKPVQGKDIRVNGFGRVTGPDGMFHIGSLPVGYSFDLDVDDIHKHIDVIKGQGNICVDITKFADIDLFATRDGAPYPNAEASVSYGDHKLNVKCDETGHAVVRMPRTETPATCTVTVDGVTIADVVKDRDNKFFINVESPKPAVKNATVEVEATSDGKPYSGASLTMIFHGETNRYVCDEDGKFTTEVQLSDTDNTCTITLDDKEETKTLVEGRSIDNKFVFSVFPEFKEDAPLTGDTKEAVVKVVALRNGAPYKDARFELSLNGKDYVYVCDRDGMFSTKLPLTDGNNECTVILDGEKKIKTLIEGDAESNKFLFRITETEPVPIEPVVIEDNGAEVQVYATLDGEIYSGAKFTMKYNGEKKLYNCDENGFFSIKLPLNEKKKKKNKCVINMDNNRLKKILEPGVNVFNYTLVTYLRTPWWVYVLEFLFAILLLIITIFTYYFCGGMLFH